MNTNTCLEVSEIANCKDYDTHKSFEESLF